MASIEKRISELEARAGKAEPPGARGGRRSGDEQDFARLLSQARRAERRDFPETPVTRQMLDDPVNGEFLGRMQAARRRGDRVHGETRKARKS